MTKCVIITQPAPQPPERAFMPNVNGMTIAKNYCAKRRAGIRAQILFEYSARRIHLYVNDRTWRSAESHTIIPAGRDTAEYTVRLGTTVKPADKEILLRFDTGPDEYPNGVHCFTTQRNSLWFTHEPTGQQVVVHLGPVSVNSGCECPPGFEFIDL